MISDAQKRKEKKKEKISESNIMTSTQNAQENLEAKTYIVQHTRERIYNQKKEWASA